MTSTPQMRRLVVRAKESENAREGSMEPPRPASPARPMSAERAWKWVALVVGTTALFTGCITVTQPGGHGLRMGRNPHAIPELSGEMSGGVQPEAISTQASTPWVHRRREHVQATKVAMVGPAEITVRAVSSGAVQVDAFEDLLLRAGLSNISHGPPRGGPLTPREAERVLGMLLNMPVTPGSFPSRLAVCHLLREVLPAGGCAIAPRHGGAPTRRGVRRRR